MSQSGHVQSLEHLKMSLHGELVSEYHPPCPVVSLCSCVERGGPEAPSVGLCWHMARGLGRGSWLFWRDSSAFQGPLSLLGGCENLSFLVPTCGVFSHYTCRCWVGVRLCPGVSLGSCPASPSSHLCLGAFQWPSLASVSCS